MKTKSGKKRRLQRIVPRGPSGQNGSLSGASNGSFRANAPARLQLKITRTIREARLNALECTRHNANQEAKFWNRVAAALEARFSALTAPEEKRALARNS